MKNILLSALVTLTIGCGSKSPPNYKFEEGYVEKIIVQEDSKDIYNATLVFIFFEDRVVKLRSVSFDEFRLPLDTFVRIEYNENLFIKKIEKIEKIEMIEK